MKVQYISNSGKDTVNSLIKARSKTCTKLYLSVGFITNSGLNEIIVALRNASLKGQVKILTGVYLGVTEPIALKELLKLSSKREDKFQTYIYSLKIEFHKKIYVFIEGKKFYAIIGSSNVTSLGLVNEGEGNVYIIGDLTKTTDKRLLNDLIKDFEPERCIKLTAKIIKDYNDQRSSYSEIIKRKVKINFKKIIGSKQTNSKSKHKKGKPEPYIINSNIYVDSINGYISKTTNAILEDETNWKNLNTYSVGHRVELKRNDMIYFLDRVNNKFYPAKFIAYCETKVRTPDGKHFIAYKPLSKYKIINQKLRSDLRSVGIVESKLLKLKKTSKDQRSLIESLFNL